MSFLVALMWVGVGLWGFASIIVFLTGIQLIFEDIGFSVLWGIACIIVSSLSAAWFLQTITNIVVFP